MPLLASVADTATGGGEAVLFWVFAALALGSAVAVVVLRNIVHAAMMLVVNLLAIAALYLGLQSSFLSIVQVIVYAGAIVVLFLFVIMLLGVDRDDLLGTKTPLRAVAAVVAGVALAGALLVVVSGDALTTASACGAQATGAGGTDAVACAGLDEAPQDSAAFVGQRLFTRWTFAFEASALLLVVATLGALVLGRRRDPALDGAEPAHVLPGDERGGGDLGDLHDDLDPDHDDLARADLRPAHDATATLDPAASRDPADTADDHRAGTTHDVTDGGADTAGRDA